MSAPNHPTRRRAPVSALSQTRRRTADRVASWLKTMAIYGGTTSVLDEWDLSISEHAVLQRILEQAPVVAASGDTDAVRVARTPRGTLTVIRLHGPDWSLVIRPGRPLPSSLLVVLDELDGGETPFSMLDCDWRPEIAAMTRAILSIHDQPHPPQ